MREELGDLQGVWNPPCPHGYIGAGYRTVRRAAGYRVSVHMAGGGGCSGISRCLSRLGVAGTCGSPSLVGVGGTPRRRRDPGDGSGDLKAWTEPSTDDSHGTVVLMPAAAAETPPCGPLLYRKVKFQT